MGTMVVLAGLTGIVFLIIRSMIRDKKNGKSNFRLIFKITEFPKFYRPATKK